MSGASIYTGIAPSAPYIHKINSHLFNCPYEDVFPELVDGCVDLIFADLPYNITQAKFDVRIPMPGPGGLWAEYSRLLKPSGVVLLTASQPFTSYLVTTAMESGFKLQCEWIWEKTQATGGLNSKRQPMKAHESVLVFVKQKSKGHTYNPQMTHGHKRKVSTAAHKHNTRGEATDLYGKHDNYQDYDSTDRFPRSVLVFKSDKQKLALHRTQKPVALVEYFLRTYSNEGELVLDNVAGSLTTAEASNNLNRRCIAIEKDETFFKKGLTRFDK